MSWLFRIRILQTDIALRLISRIIDLGHHASLNLKFRGWLLSSKLPGTLHSRHGIPTSVRRILIQMSICGRVTWYIGPQVTWYYSFTQYQFVNSQNHLLNNCFPCIQVCSSFRYIQKWEINVNPEMKMPALPGGRSTARHPARPNKTYASESSSLEHFLLVRFT